MKNKLFTSAERKEISTEERAITAYGSRPVIDRDNELIEARAWELEAYRKNPVLMLSHDYSKPPVGRVMWCKANDDGLIFKAQFHDKTDEAEEIWELYKDGFMNSFSVGFKPVAWRDGKGQGEPKRTYTKAELLEISCVSVPANASARVIQAAYDTGLIKTPMVQKALGVGETDEQKIARLEARVKELEEQFDEEVTPEDIAEMVRIQLDLAKGKVI
ncbi:MAG: HK97 family phage prohead protease [Thermodesulfobacteriota bacterium]|nr:HK97 family phage prohead protease [Thermodesulfobacteriota bacterium]